MIACSANQVLLYFGIQVYAVVLDFQVSTYRLDVCVSFCLVNCQMSVNKGAGGNFTYLHCNSKFRYFRHL